jgi:hypothetical protein
MALKGKEVDGFVFATMADADIARDEIRKIKHIAEKMDYGNPELVLAAYNKMITNRILITPIGYAYLRELQLYLYSNINIEDEQVKSIPLYAEFGTISSEKSKFEAPYIKPKEKKNYRKQYIKAVWACIVLSVIVIAMFFITLNADNPNIINYKAVLENQYADWEQSLTDREAVIREKEKELLINPVAD